MAIFTKIFAIVGAIKEIASLGNRILDMYGKYQDGRIDRHYESKQKRRERLLKQIDKETDDDKLRDLHRRLRNLDSVRV